MKAVITVQMDNAAFENWQIELARILKELAEKLDTYSGDYKMSLRDYNGNKVGELAIH